MIKGVLLLLSTGQLQTMPLLGKSKRYRLHQSINQYPVDLFNSFVARLRLANKHLFDKRSTEGHD